ncbi:MAG: hypothetical protein JXM71_03520, partial [Spirochaetales bacterium]|nr:hypothetical protein [Spirochaetales bacterium]
MDLLTLNLNQSLTWSRADALTAGATAPATAMGIIDAASEAAEAALVWRWESLVLEGSDDGPRVISPLPPPERVAASGLLPGESAAADTSLEAGRYLFIQTRPPAAIAGYGGDGDEASAWLA